MNVRTADLEDLDAIVEIYNHAVVEQATADTEPVTVESRRDWFHRHPAERRPILVAVDDGRVVGWASLGDYRGGRGAVRHTAEISYYIHRDHRRRGVASRLLRDAIGACPGLGIEILFGIMLEDNVASTRLLEKHGFERWGKLPKVADFDGRRVGHVYYGRSVDSS